MRRREFVTLLGGATAAWPQKVLSEGRNRPPVVAWLWFGSPGGICLRDMAKLLRNAAILPAATESLRRNRS
jgi:hypothetical protein